MAWTHRCAVMTRLTGTALAQAPLPAQQSPRDAVRLGALPRGVFVLRQGARVARLNLEGRLNSCTGGLYDGSDPASRPSGGEA